MGKYKQKMSGGFYLLCFVIAVFILLGIFAQGFYTINNLMSILNTFSYTLIAAIGMNMIMITGNIDISAGSAMSLICIVCAALGYMHVPLAGLLAAGILIGGLLSLLNAYLTVKLNVASMVITLATSQIFAGVLPIFNESTLYNLPASFNWLSREAKIFGVIPGSAVIALIVTVFFVLFMKYSKFSKKLYAIGNNAHGATLIGVDVNKVLMVTYLTAGALFGISAVIIVTAAARVTNVMASGMEFNLIASVILGGTNPAGGSGKVSGTILGALLLSIITSAIQYIGLSSNYQDVVKGFIIITTVIAISMKNIKRRRNIAEEKERMVAEI